MSKLLTQSLIRACASKVTVSGTPSWSLSSTAVTPKSTYGQSNRRAPKDIVMKSEKTVVYDKDHTGMSSHK